MKGPDGKPVEGALVLARPTSSVDPPDSTKTDTSGRFRIAVRRPSPHLVRVEAKGFAGRTLERVAPGKPLEILLQKGALIQGAVFDGRTAEPVEGARVEARPQDITLSLLADPSVGVVQTVTDAKGRFRLENVASGLHSLSADARGYGRASRTPVPSGGRAELFLFPGASIAGVVRDTDDKPVAGAIVRAETDMPQRSGPPRAEVTSADGRFLVVGIEPGTYRLALRHKDHAPAVVSDVVVRPESEAQADVVLSPGGSIVGRLLDGDSRPVRGRAALSDLDGKPAARGLTDLLRTETDSEGRFRLASAPAGSHVLSLTAPGFAATRVDVAVRDRQETDAGDVVLETGLAIRGSVRTKAGAAIPEATVSTSAGPTLPPLVAQVEADGSFMLSGIGPGRHQLRAFATGYGEARKPADAGADGIDFVLSPAGSISGSVVDEAGQPVESFRVTARGAPPTGPNMPFSFASKTIGSADGRFSLDLPVDGPHVVEVAAPNYATASLSKVAVVLGQAIDVGRIRLSSGGTVRGLVVDAAGAPVAGASVTIRGAGRETFGPGPQGTSDVTGAFDVRGVTAGTVEAVASHPSFAEGRASAIDVDPSKGPSETRIVMTRGGRVEGFVRRRDGIGLPGMVVMLWPTQSMASMPPQVVTGEDGSFTVEHVRPGRIRATLMAGTAGRYTSMQDREIDVREGETTGVDFASRDILLSGRVTRNGEPAPGLQLRLSSTGGFAASMVTGPPDSAMARGPQRMAATTDAEGRYEMLVNEPGKLRMNAQSTDNRRSLPMQFVEVPDVDAHVANIDYGGALLQGVVVDKESGQPIADVQVMARLKKPQPGQMAGGSGMSGPDGRFQMELEPAEYRIDTRMRGYVPESVEVTVETSGTPDLRLALARGAALEGHVVDERGRGIGGVNVFASIPAEPGENRPPTSSGGGNTQPDGGFVIEGLQQQPHVVVVRSNIGSFAIQTGVSPGDRDVALTLKPGGTLQVLVLGPDGAPLQGALAITSKVNGVRAMSMGGASTDARGAAEFQVPAGDLEIRVTKEKLQGTGNVSVAERGAAALEVKLSEGPPKPRLP